MAEENSTRSIVRSTGWARLISLVLGVALLLAAPLVAFGATE